MKTLTLKDAFGGDARGFGRASRRLEAVCATREDTETGLRCVMRPEASFDIVGAARMRSTNVADFFYTCAALSTSSFASKASAPRRGAVQVVAADKRSRPSVADVSEFQKSANDTGSSSVQIALLTKRIEGLTVHLMKNKKDYATQRGLKKLLGQRSRLQNYLAKKDYNEYVKTMQGLGLRIK